MESEYRGPDKESGQINETERGIKNDADERDTFDRGIKDAPDDTLAKEAPSQYWIRSQMNKVFSLLGYTPPTSPNIWKCKHRKHTYYFPNIKTIFTGIPKAGSSNWIEFLLRAEGALNTTIKPEQVNVVHTDYKQTFRMGYNDNYKKAADAGDVFSFAVVRNPWTRLVSGYRDKLSPELGTVGKPFMQLAKLIAREMHDRDNISELSNHPTFDQFLRWFPDNFARSNDHFTPQHNTLCIPSVTYDYIIPLEYANLLNSMIVERIHTPTQLYGSYDNASDARKQSSAVRAKEWLSKQDPGLIDRIYKIFEADFTLMNYSNFSHPDFPLPLHSNN